MNSNKKKIKKEKTTLPPFNLALKTIEERGFIQFDFGGKSDRKEFIIFSPFVNKDKKLTVAIRILKNGCYYISSF